MSFRSKRTDPIARAINDLDQQIASLQRQMRETANGGTPAISGPEPTAGEISAAQSKAHTLTRRAKELLFPPRRSVDRSSQARRDLFDIAAEPLKDLEAEPIAFAQKPEPDLFSQGTMNPGRLGAASAALEHAQVVSPDEKLAHYLGAGSIKSYKPLKRAQRQARNRFFMWLGLSFVALWIIWFVIR